MILKHETPGMRLMRPLVFVLSILSLMKIHSGTAAEPLAEDMRQKIEQPWKGDFDPAGKRKYIRAVLTYSKTTYFLDGAQQKGPSYDLLKLFEEFINVKVGGKNIKFHVVIIPVRRDQLISALQEGKADIAASNLSITPDRLKRVDFSDPLLENVKEVVVTRSKDRPIARLHDLCGLEIWVRRSSSFHESLLSLNEAFKKEGRPEIRIRFADENLESEDLLEMIHAGVIPATIVDSHIAEFWAEIFPNIQVHWNVPVREGGKIAWALRRNMPRLKSLVNEFIREHRKGTLLGNILYKRYLKSHDWVKNPLAGKELKKFQDTLPYFKKFGDQYGFDWILVAAQGYQESRLDQGVRSSAGAIGVMQVKPSTAADKRVNISDIHKIENNIHAGVKYLRVIADTYFSNDQLDPINECLLAMASYNAGPARVSELRRKAAGQGLDPKIWFQNVEIIAAREIGSETVTYVSNIFKYYLAYRLIVERWQEKKQRHNQGQMAAAKS